MKGRLAFTAFASLVAAACFDTAFVPGDETLGAFAFKATPSEVPPGETRCAYAEFNADAGFDFSATLTRSTQTGAAFFTKEGFSRDAGYDGQVFETVWRESARFAACSCAEETRVEESLRLTLLSESQRNALGGNCPTGGPPPVDPDAGIFAPGPGEGRYDAILACGELTLTVVPTFQPGMACGTCTRCMLRYRVTGDRQ